MAAKVTRFAYVRGMEFSEDENGVREYRDYYLAETSERVGAIDALRRKRPDLQRWQPHKEDKAALVRRFAVQQRKHSLLWDITVDYSTAAGEEEDNPLDLPAAVELGESTITQAVSRDANGNWLTNSAGKLLEGLDEEFSFVNFSISKNIGPWPAWLLLYRQAVNSDAVYLKGLNCAPRTLKIGSLTIGSEQQFEDTSYAQLRMNLIYNEDTWDRFFLNRGFEEVAVRLKTVKGQKVVEYSHQLCTDRLNQPLSEPAFLDADGRRPRIDPATKKLVTLDQEIAMLKRGETPVTAIKNPLDKEDIIFLRKQMRKPLPFNVLPLR